MPLSRERKRRARPRDTQKASEHDEPRHSVSVEILDNSFDQQDTLLSSRKHKRRRRSRNTQDTYEYDELPRGDVFRYLILQPGVENERLRCSLHTATMTETPFEAISYVWGSDIKNQEIICDGRILKITTNLSKVLRRVRLPDAPRSLWADSICINQDDRDEKGHQVAIMGQIYRTAERVLAYMGSDEDGHGPDLCSLLEDVNEMIEETCKLIDMSWNSFPFPDKDDPKLTDPRWESLHKLLSQDWFDRGWVVRETALAQCCQVIWGHSEFTWEKLMRAYIWLHWRAPSTFYSGDFIQSPMVSHRAAFEQRHKDFAQVFLNSLAESSVLEDLENARDLQLSDPRDRIYAFMQLSESYVRQIDICPNYNESHLEVYRHFAIQYIQSAQDIGILDYVSHYARALDSKLPSWIPRWDSSVRSVAGPSEFWPVLKPHAMPIREPTVIDEAILKVRGVIIGTVQYVSDTLTFDRTTPKTIQHIWKSVNMLTEESPYPESHRLDAFLDTLCRGVYIGDWLQWRQSRSAFMVDAQLLNTQITPVSDAARFYYNYIRNFLHKRRIILTTRGYMGLAPAVTQVGDLCGIVFGCKTPCILQRAAQENHYLFLGSAYVMGKQSFNARGGGLGFWAILGAEDSKDWIEWDDVEEQDIYLC